MNKILQQPLEYMPYQSEIAKKCLLNLKYLESAMRPKFFFEIPYNTSPLKTGSIHGRSVLMRGVYNCSLCNKAVGCHCYTLCDDDNYYEWNACTSHYMEEHNVEPTVVFDAFVTRCVELLLHSRMKKNGLEEHGLKENELKENDLKEKGPESKKIYKGEEREEV